LTKTFIFKKLRSVILSVALPSVVMLIVVEPFTIYNGTKRYKKVSNRWKTKNTYNLGTSGACVIKLITAVIYLDPMVKP
jgi:hypothetical protein